MQSASTATSSHQPIYSEALTYYSNGNVATANDSINGNWTYTYDTLNRLTNAVTTPNTGENCQYGYDAFGNFKSEGPAGSGSCLSKSFTYSTATNRIDGYCYDGAGNVLDAGACPPAGSNHQNYYDGWGHLLSGNFNVTPLTSYTVDSLDHRVAKWTGGTVERQYLYGVDGNPVAETDGSGNWQQTNVHAGGMFLAEYKGSTSPTYLHNDHLGTMRASTNPSGGIVETCTNLPFGDLENCSDSGNPSGYHFTGKEHDPETRDDYFGARYYASSMGRWLSPDWSAKEEPVPYAKMDNPQSLNLYAYVGNNPLSGVDADGHVAPRTSCNGPCPQIDPIQFYKSALIGLAKTLFNVAFLTVQSDTGGVKTLPMLQPSNPAEAFGMVVGPLVVPALSTTITVSASLPTIETESVALSDDALVIRGGVATPQQLTNGAESVAADGTLQGVSVNSANGASVEDLSQGFPNKQVSVTTVGKVRSIGGDVTPTPTDTNPVHCDMCNVNANDASKIFNQQSNPNPPQVDQ